MKTDATLKFDQQPTRGPIPRNSLLITDLDGKGQEELVFYRADAWDGNDRELYYQQQLLVYRIDSEDRSFDKPVGMFISPNPPGGHARGFFPGIPYTIDQFQTSQIVMGDFDGGGLSLGKPKYFRKSTIQQPLVILNAPPIHFDVIDGAVYDLNGCYPRSRWMRILRQLPGINR